MRKFYSLILLGLFATQVLADKIPEYCIDNDVVHRYLTEVQYDPNDYSYSKITDYCYSFPWDWEGEGKGVRLDIPKPVTIKFDALAAASTIYVSETEDFANAYTVSIPAGQDSVDVYNLIPNRLYNFKIEWDNGGVMTVAKSGQFRTTGNVRMLKIDGIYNVRDLGGWIGLGGNPIKYGKLIRGSRLNVNNATTLLITADGINELRRLGITAELDMRNSSNAANATHSFLGADIPIYNVENAYNSRIATFADAPQSIEGINKLIQWFREGRSVYMHCSVGADRTGTVAYLVGALCGMSEDALCKEFELTSFSGDKVVNERQEANGDYERLVRQRDYSGRLDPNDNPDSYKFASMVDKIKSFQKTEHPEWTLQQRVQWHLRTGVDGVKVSPADLAFLVDYLTGYKILAGFNTDVDTVRLEKGQTHKLKVTPFPAEAEYTSITFKGSTSKYVATITADGTITATGGGKAYVLVDVDGIEKYIPVIVPITETSVPGYTTEGEAVHNYLTETHYSADDYSVSTVENYLTGSGRKDWSQSVTFKWMVYPGATNQRLRISETPSFEIFASYDKADEDSTHTLSGLEPQKLYYYKVIATFNGRTDTLISSAFKTTGSVKMINLKKVYNVRDMGGVTGMNGHKVQYGKLFRGSRLKGNTSEGGKVISTEDVKDLLRLGITAELDLRSNDETNSTTSALNREYSYSRIADAINAQGMYVTCNDAYIKALNTIIGWMKDYSEIVYINSTYGAERTGTLAFLINGLLGVDEESLCKDYELSSFSGDKNAPLCKRNTGDFPAMVAAIKGLNGNTLQEKIYKYFFEGISGLEGSATISKADLNWFISYMLGCPASEVESSPMTRLESVKAPVITGKIYNLLGQEVENPGPGIYIMNGKKFIIK